MNAILKPRLFDYQELGVKHLLSAPFGRPHALLADEQGTGKTCQAIEAAKEANCKTAIILCPAIIKEQWRREIIRWGWADDDQIQTVYGLDAEIDSRPIVIVNYDIIRDTKKTNEDGSVTKIRSKNKQRLFDRKSHVLIMDEAHRLKNHLSAQTKAVLHQDHGIAKNCYYKWALTGSFVPNRPAECFPLTRSLAPEVLGKYRDWESYKYHYCGGAWADGKGASNVDELTAALQPFMLRRSLADVWSELPETYENVQWLDVPYEQHPEWIGESFMELGTVRRVVAEAKIPQVVAYLNTRFEGGSEKMVLVTYHRKVTDGVAAHMPGYHPLKIYGGITNNKRDENLRKFIEDPQHRLLLLQIVSGGEGVDGLQHVTSELVLAEPEWSPGREDQAIARIRRRGQTKPVLLTKLYAKNSYEEAIYWSNQTKREVIDVILKPNGGIFVAKNTTNNLSFEDRLESIDNGIKELVALWAKQQNFTPTGAVPGAAAMAAPAASVPNAPPSVPSVPSVPFSPPAIPSVSAPPVVAAISSAPPAPPVLSVVPALPDDAQKTFYEPVLEMLKTTGDENGRKLLDKLNATFHIGKLGDLDPAHRSVYMQHVQAAVSNPAAYLAAS